MAGWFELLGKLGGTVADGSGTSVAQSSLSELLGTYFDFANKNIANSDQMGLPDDYISAADAAQMGAVLVAQRIAQPITPLLIPIPTSSVTITPTLTGKTPMAPVVGFFKDPDDPTLFQEAPQSTVYHAQIGIVPRADDFSWMGDATECRVERFISHEENTIVVKDWTLLLDIPSGIVWDFYIRNDLRIGYRIKFRGAGETNWSSWHPGNETALISEKIVTKPGRDVDPEVIINTGQGSGLTGLSEFA